VKPLIDSNGCRVYVGDKVRYYVDGKYENFAWLIDANPESATVQRLDGALVTVRVGDHGEEQLPEARLFGPHDERD
jgi:hypothetical protein